MKKLFISMLALAIGAGAAQAQQDSTHAMHHFSHRGAGGPGGQGGFGGSGGPGGFGRGRGAHGPEQMMAKKLNFSDQQKQQLKDINNNYRKQLADLDKDLDITVREQRAKMASIRKDHLQQVQALYTTEQKAEIQKMKDQRQEMAKVNAKAREDKMKIKLGLSDDQAQKLKDLRTATFSKMKDLRSNQSLTPDQKKEQMKAIVDNQKQQMKSVLTPDQLKQMDQMHHGRQGGWSK